MAAGEQIGIAERLIDQRQVGIEARRLQRELECRVNCRRVAKEPFVQAHLRKAGIGRGIGRINGGGPLVKGAGVGQRLFRKEPVLLAPAKNAVISFGRRGLRPLRQFVCTHKADLQRLDDLLRHIVLNREDVGKIAIIPLRPGMAAALAVDQLTGHAYPVARLAHAALQHVMHAKCPRDILNIAAFPFEGEAGVAGDDEQALEAGQLGDDILGDAIGEIVLLRIAGHIGEGQHRDGGFLGQRERFRNACGRDAADRPAPDGNRPRDILERLRPAVRKDCRRLAIETVPRAVGNQQSPGLGQRFEPRGDIDAVAIDILLLENHLTDMDADPEAQEIMVREPFLHLHRAVNRIGDAGEFDQPAISHALDDLAAMVGDGGFEQVPAHCPERRKRAGLIRAHQAGIIHHIGGENGAQAALHGFILLFTASLAEINGKDRAPAYSGENDQPGER